MQYNSLKQMPSGGLASFLESNMDEIGDNVLAFGAPQGINSMTDIGNRMANMGRNGDNQLVHMKTGEIAVSPDLLEENPRLANELTQAFDRSNVDMDRYTAGSGANSINPVTGQREFFLKKLIGGIKNLFKKIAPILVPLAINFFAPGLGTVAAGALGSGIGTLVQGGSLKEAFKSAALGGLMGGVSAFAKVGGPAGATTRMGRAFGTMSGEFEGSIFNPKSSLVAPAVIPPPANVVTDKINPDAASSSRWDNLKGFWDKNFSSTREGIGYLNPEQKLDKAAKMVEASTTGLEMTDALKLVDKMQPNMLTRYGPMALAGTAAFAAAGGFETPEEDISSPYGRTSREEFESNPNKYSIYSGINFRGPLSGRRPDITRNPFVFQDYLMNQPDQYAASGGEMLQNRQGMRAESLQGFPRRDGYIGGPGTETSDDIPAMLSDGEFVMTSKAVRGLGNGSRKQGVRKMYDMMRAFEGGVAA